MGLKHMVIPVTTDGAGAETAYGSRTIRGQIYAIHWNVGTCVAGVDVTIATQGSTASKTHLTLTDANASAMYYPRDLQHSETGTALTGTAGGDRTLPMLDGLPVVTVAQGGATKTGTVTIFWLE
jgi:hypothetical protein